MKKFLSAFLAAGLMAALLAGCGNTDFERESSSVEMVPASSSEPVSSEPVPEPEPMVEAMPGEITGDIYTNDSLGIMMTLPAGWYHMSADELAALIDSEPAADADSSAAIDSSAAADSSAADESAAQEEPVEGSAALDKGLVPLFWIAQADPAENDASNANMSFSAESTGAASTDSQVMTEYLAAVKQMYQSIKDVDGTEVRYTVRGPEAVDINGTEFQKMTATMSNITGTKMMTRDIYICIDRGYVLNLTATYFDDGQRDMIDESIQTLTITAA